MLLKKIFHAQSLPRYCNRCVLDSACANLCSSQLVSYHGNSVVAVSVATPGLERDRHEGDLYLVVRTSMETDEPEGDCIAIVSAGELSGCHVCGIVAANVRQVRLRSASEIGADTWNSIAELERKTG